MRTAIWILVLTFMGIAACADTPTLSALTDVGCMAQPGTRVVGTNMYRERLGNREQWYKSCTWEAPHNQPVQCWVQQSDGLRLDLVDQHTSHHGQAGETRYAESTCKWGVTVVKRTPPPAPAAQPEADKPKADEKAEAPPKG